MNTRIQEFMKEEGLTAARLADSLNVQRSNISHIISGRNKPSLDFIEKILKVYPQLSTDWLIMGKGAMYKNLEPTLFPPYDVISKYTPKTPTETNLIVDEISETDKQIKFDSKIKQVERVMIFYTDSTFDTYTPSKKSSAAE